MMGNIRSLTIVIEMIWIMHMIRIIFLLDLQHEQYI